MRDKAKTLWLEWKNTSGLLMYSPRNKAGYRTRVRNTAKRISKTLNTQDNIFALMYLGQLETWLNIDLHQYLKD